MTLALLLLLAQSPWPLHTIDASLTGADGVRLKDINGDGLPDVATGWEEGRAVRFYLHPPRPRTRQLKSWPATTVGQVCQPEDAVFADLDGDGRDDVISACEQGQPTGVYVHWAPDWKTEALTAASPLQRWIYTLPFRFPNDKRTHLITGGKLPNADIRWISPGDNPRDLSQWKFIAVDLVGWTMSLIAADMNANGADDVLVSDRSGPTSGIFWLEAPNFFRHNIGAKGEEVMFLDYADLNGDGLKDIAAAIRPESIVWFERLDTSGLKWRRHSVPYPPGAGTAKAVAIGDLNGDGRADLAFTCENAGGDKHGVWWLERLPDGNWRPHSISGPTGIKFDRIELLDIDGDGDLDLLTTEERTPLGVIWYENPQRR
ncbi:MAG: VCBS repeat-containing protein [Bryobacter sp.]|jgi:hypothetical protein|nr:VCBS repeat-containing protein [Bryobacter sp. CoA8 C33]